jgi:hypothetical protein
MVWARRGSAALRALDGKCPLSGQNPSGSAPRSRAAGAVRSNATQAMRRRGTARERGGSRRGGELLGELTPLPGRGFAEKRVCDEESPVERARSDELPRVARVVPGWRAALSPHPSPHASTIRPRSRCEFAAHFAGNPHLDPRRGTGTGTRHPLSGENSSRDRADRDIGGQTATARSSPSLPAFVHRRRLPPSNGTTRRGAPPDRPASDAARADGSVTGSEPPGWRALRRVDPLSAWIRREAGVRREVTGMRGELVA